MHDISETDSAEAIAQRTREDGSPVVAELMDDTLAAVDPRPRGYGLAVPDADDPVAEVWWTAVVFGAALEREYPRDEGVATTEVGP